jgi:hypothetical protein
MSAVGVVRVCVIFEVCVFVGYGSTRVWGMSVYGHVQWHVDTYKPVVYVVSGGCPSGTWLARMSARSLPIEWLCGLILPRWVRVPELHRVASV